MNVFLMHPTKDFDPEKEISIWQKDLMEDLALEPVIQVMSGSSELIRKVASIALLSPLKKKDEIKYRQDILKDVLKNPGVIEKLYNLAIEAKEAERKSRFGFFTHHLGGILYSAIELMKMLLDFLKRLRELAIKNEENFSSSGFKRFFRIIREELTPEYFSIIETHLRLLEFKGGVLIRAELGMGNKGKGYTLCKPPEEKVGLFNRIFSKREASYTFTIDERDESGERAISEIKERGINSVTNALAQSVEHILCFFEQLKTELAFYIGVLNLHRHLKELGGNMCFPLLSDNERYDFSDLYDPSLAITLKKKVVGNELRTEGKRLFIITGANQGGKSTFLRSIGIAQLMMQAGIFVCAARFSAPIKSGIYTHFRREEDREMESGKLDEELRRMNGIIDAINPGGMILFNESFASTNEKEGSEVAFQIVNALVESGITVFFVTHMYKLASDFYNAKRKDVLFLRAQRKEDGTRTFRIIEGAPLKTSHGEDIYKKVFGV